MPSSLRALAVVLLALATAACNSTVANGPMPPAHDAADSAKTKVKATLRIAIPKRKHGHRVLLRGHYVSLSTESIAIAIEPAAGGTVLNFNADVTAASNPSACVRNLSGNALICTITVNLAPTNYVMKISSYDGLLSGGNAPNNPPTGNELSANQSLPFTVTPGQHNQIPVTLGGVPASVVLVPAANSTLTGNDATGFTLARCLPAVQDVNVYGVDADGNYILGVGAPQLALASNDQTNLPVTATPRPSALNQFALTPADYPTANATVELTASVTPAAESGALPKSAQISVTFPSTTCYSTSEYSAHVSSSSGTTPTGIASGGSFLWYTFGTNLVAKMTTGGSIQGVYTARTGADSLAFDGTNMWVTNSAATPGSVTKVLPNGATGGTFTVGTAPNAIAFDGTNMWVANSATNNVTELSSSGTPSGPFGALNDPDAIAYDGNGHMWVANYGGSPGTVTELSSSGATLGTFTVGTEPDGIAFDGTDMWVTNYNDGTITVLNSAGSTVHTFSIPTTNSGPGGITLGHDGAMWFTEINGNKIGRVTSTGSFTEFTVPTGTSKPTGIAVGPDQNIWFTENATDKIGTVITH